jgi:single-strand DNA-binding protein
MSDFNKVLLSGRLTSKPEFKKLGNDNNVASFSLASKRIFNSNGEKREETTFVDIDLFGNSAKAIAEYGDTGRDIFIEGRLKLDKWKDKESGQKRSKLFVIAENFKFLDSPKGN